ncbi:MAG: PDZ domain-containing protein [Pseudomonadota bacterium]
MKQLLLVCLLGMSTACIAQTVTSTEKGAKADEARRSPADAKREADETKKRAELDAARVRLDKATREVMELSRQLAENSRGDMLFFSTDRHAMLGVQIDPESGKEGARVRTVSPGGPAAAAGLQNGDVIIQLDGNTVAGGENAGRALIDQMRSVQPDQKVKVRVIRSGKNKDLIVIARPFAGGVGGDERMFGMHPMPEMAGPMTGMAGVAGLPGTRVVRQLRFNFPDEFGGMELASITPKLGAYFGATEGVLVVQAPENGSLKLEDGDVIQTIDGRKPEDGTHALRILRSYSSGEKLNLKVLRQRKQITLAVTMPDRPEMQDFLDAMPPPPVPPAPPAPPMGATGPGTDE